MHDRHLNSPDRTARPKASLQILPAEILLPILVNSLSPSLIHSCRQTRSVLPPYVQVTKAMAAIATCPEGPNSRILSLVFDRVMEKYHLDCCVVLLTQAARWQIREAVWSSQWFGHQHFEIIVLELYRAFLSQTLRLFKHKLSPELTRLKIYMLGCLHLDEVIGEEFVAAVKMRRTSLTGKEQSRGVSKADLLFTFNSITLFQRSDEHRLCIWGESLYDLPDGLFHTPVTMHQLGILKFLTTLALHWKSNRRSILMPKSNHALGRAVSWAIQSQEVYCLDILLGLYDRIRQAGNEQALNLAHHMKEATELADRRMLKHLCRGIGIPASVVEIFDSLATLPNNEHKLRGPGAAEELALHVQASD